MISISFALGSPSSVLPEAYILRTHSLRYGHEVCLVLHAALGFDLSCLSLAADLPCKTAESGQPTGFLACSDKSAQCMGHLEGGCSSGMVLGPGMALLTASHACRYRHEWVCHHEAPTRAAMATVDKGRQLCLFMQTDPSLLSFISFGAWSSGRSKALSKHVVWSVYSLTRKH